MAGGFLSGKVSAKIYVWAAAAMFLGGFMLSARITSLMELYIGFGVICGFASGLAYNAVMGTISRWFPDKQGLISGVLLMGFGGGSFLIGKLYQAWTPAGVGGWRTSFLVLGIVCFAVLAVCSFFFVAPGADFTAPAVKGGKTVSRPAAADVTPGQMLKKTTFWLYYVWAIAVSAAGLALISQASGVVWQASADHAAGERPVHPDLCGAAAGHVQRQRGGGHPGLCTGWPGLFRRHAHQLRLLPRLFRSRPLSGEFPPDQHEPDLRQLRQHRLRCAV